MAVAAGCVANGIRLRARASALAVLDHSARQGEGWQPDTAASDEWTLQCAEGVDVDPATLAAAAAWAESSSSDVVDLVPADLPTEQALELLRGHDPKTYRQDRFAPGASAYQAVAVRAAIAAQADVPEDAVADQPTLVRSVAELKRHAPVSADLVVAPGLSGRSRDLSKQRGILASRVGVWAPVALALPLLGYATLALGLLLAPLWGLAAPVA